jgi:hypothetical protein
MSPSSSSLVLSPLSHLSLLFEINFTSASISHSLSTSREPQLHLREGIGQWSKKAHPYPSSKAMDSLPIPRPHSQTASPPEARSTTSVLHSAVSTQTPTTSRPHLSSPRQSSSPPSQISLKIPEDVQVIDLILDDEQLGHSKSPGPCPTAERQNLQNEILNQPRGSIRYHPSH